MLIIAHLKDDSSRASKCKSVSLCIESVLPAFNSSIRKKQWHRTSCQLITITAWLFLMWQAAPATCANTSPRYMLLLLLLLVSPSSLLLLHFLTTKCLRWHLWHCASCIFHILAMQRVSAGFCSAHPLGYFYTLHSESHTVWIHLGKHPLATFLINTIAYSFAARKWS